MPRRVHLLINESSGEGHHAGAVRRIRSVLDEAFGEVETSVVSDHASAASRAKELVERDDRPATLFVGGGGGTLRGVIEGVAAARDGRGLPGPERLQLAPLRMGSGNVLAKELGVPRDPTVACERLVAGSKSGRLRHCSIGRYEFEREGGGREIRFAATLAGFGQLGRVPGDLERWQARFPGLRRWLRRLVGIERWNDVEYGGAMLVRCVASALWARAVEEIEVRGPGEPLSLRVLAGVVMSFPVPALPFEDPPAADEEKLTLYLVPRASRTQCLSLVLGARRHARSAARFDVVPGRDVEIRLRDRERVEMFLDEDPIWLGSKLTISLAGTLSFVEAA